jgi:NADPH:quinone reductase-like Zn-dependent oxidoreductase
VLGRQFIAVARVRGVKTINIVRRKEQVDEIKAIGGDEVIWSEQPGLDVAAAIRKITGGKGAWGAIECVGGALTKAIVSGVRDGGKVVIYGAMSGLDFVGGIPDVLFRGVSIHGFWLSTYALFQDVCSPQRWLEHLGPERQKRVFLQVLELMASGVVTPYVGESFPLENIAEAFKKATASARGGKVLLISQ